MRAESFKLTPEEEKPEISAKDMGDGSVRVFYKNYFIECYVDQGGRTVARNPFEPGTEGRKSPAPKSVLSKDEWRRVIAEAEPFLSRYRAGAEAGRADKEPFLFPPEEPGAGRTE